MLRVKTTDEALRYKKNLEKGKAKQFISMEEIEKRISKLESNLEQLEKMLHGTIKRIVELEQKIKK